MDEITVLIGAAVPAERNMKTKSSEYVITAPFCVHKQDFLKAANGSTIFFTQISEGAKMMKIYIYIYKGSSIQIFNPTSQ